VTTRKTDTMEKKIKHVLFGRDKKITEDETVKQPLPHKDFRFANPFIVIHHIGPNLLRAGQQNRIHPHPHRGFSPYTFMLQGEGYHRDNAGNNEIIREGGIQWMFAGKGILHSEGPTEELLKTGGVYEAVQLWINAPAANKRDKPFYQSAQRSALPSIVQEDGVDLRLASGEYGEFTGPIQQFTPVISVVGEITKNKSVHFDATPGFWTMLYIIKGSVRINEQSINPFNLVVFEKDNDEISLVALEDAQILYLSAEPINEPVAAKDNYVMNTPQEIDEAMEDYRNGLFGSLDA
jgi:redox-sensitive bicupin YhaK (pirin superfamily)